MAARGGTDSRFRARTVVVAAVVLVALAGAAVMALRSGSGQAGQANAASGGMAGMGAQVPAGPPSGAGPVTDIDRTFLVKVRQAGLWEMPAGQLAQTHAESVAVKRAGMHLIDGHSKLDELVREDASMLGVGLPDQASPEQQGWVQQLTDAQGPAFDRLFVNLLRASHGKIFATIAEVRASTQNDLIRRHARQASETVMDHMEVLEDTGLVDPKTLQDVAAAVAPAPAK